MEFGHSRISVLLVDTDGGRMDCEDDGSAKIWVVVSAWSYRRAILTHAAPFLEVAGIDNPYDLPVLDFEARVDGFNPPSFEHEGGERIEFPGLRLATPIAEIYKKLAQRPGDFEARLSFSDAVELAEEGQADIRRTEWPEGCFLRLDKALDRLMLHSPHRANLDWRPTQDDVRLCDWIARWNHEDKP